ncbi:MAG: hypothetical protein P8P48_01215 [Saprospiraceae bacterium]|jgi:hypothetical protein|nr:hypothetical protein [Saprospiraceae bacterium]
MTIFKEISDSVKGSFNVELPEKSSLSEYLDLILPHIRNWGEDINEVKFFSSAGGKPWLEIRDGDNFNSTIMHFFNDKGEYLRSTNGDILKGRWRLLPDTNKIIIEAGSSELYDLAYLDSAFFILRKSGAPGGRKYFVMGIERYVKGLEWREFVDLLFSIYLQKHSGTKWVRQLFIAVVIICILVFFVLR